MYIHPICPPMSIVAEAYTCCTLGSDHTAGLDLNIGEDSAESMVMRMLLLRAMATIGPFALSYFDLQRHSSPDSLRCAILERVGAKPNAFSVQETDLRSHIPGKCLPLEEGFQHHIVQTRDAVRPVWCTWIFRAMNAWLYIQGFEKDKTAPILQSVERDSVCNVSCSRPR